MFDITIEKAKKHCDETAGYSVCDGRPNGDVGGSRNLL